MHHHNLNPQRALGIRLRECPPAWGEPQASSFISLRQIPNTRCWSPSSRWHSSPWFQMKSYKKTKNGQQGV